MELHPWQQCIGEAFAVLLETTIPIEVNADATDGRWSRRLSERSARQLIVFESTCRWTRAFVRQNGHRLWAAAVACLRTSCTFRPETCPKVAWHVAYGVLAAFDGAQVFPRLEDMCHRAQFPAAYPDLGNRFEVLEEALRDIQHLAKSRKPKPPPNPGAASASADALYYVMRVQAPRSVGKIIRLIVGRGLPQRSTFEPDGLYEDTHPDDWLLNWPIEPPIVLDPTDTITAPLLENYNSLSVSLVAVDAEYFCGQLLYSKRTYEHLRGHFLFDEDILPPNFDAPFEWPNRGFTALSEYDVLADPFCRRLWFVDDSPHGHIFSSQLNFSARAGPHEPESLGFHPSFKQSFEDGTLPHGAVSIRRVQFLGLKTTFDPDTLTNTHPSSGYQHLRLADLGKAVGSVDAAWIRLDTKRAPHPSGADAADGADG